MLFHGLDSSDVPEGSLCFHNFGIHTPINALSHPRSPEFSFRRLLLYLALFELEEPMLWLCSLYLGNVNMLFPVRIELLKFQFSEVLNLHMPLLRTEKKSGLC
jgi:hypothetical protein